MMVCSKPDASDEHAAWIQQAGKFVSRPLAKILFDNGLGFYILNSYKFCYFPCFYGAFRKDSWEFGFYFARWIFEIMWNKHYKI